MNSLVRNIQVIAICGRKRTGKDTVAEYLCENYGYKNVKFAEPLKETMKCLFGFTEKQIEVDKEVVDNVWGITPRHAMQFFGTEIMQFKLQEIIPSIGRDFFAKSLVSKYRHDKIVISDMRFLHESNMIRSVFPDSMIIKLENPDIEGNNDTHMSESGIDDIVADYTIINNKTKQDLFDTLDYIMKANRQ